jgi:hypothetical protein
MASLMTPILFLLFENASRRFSSRSGQLRQEAERNGHKSLLDPSQQSFHQPFNYLSCSFRLIRQTPHGGFLQRCKPSQTTARL